jgi:hypothetical protein
MIKISNFKRNSFGHSNLELGIYLGFGICNLGLGAKIVQE